MDNKPSLQEYLSTNPDKGLNDYFKKYGEPEPVIPPQPEPELIPEVQPVAVDNTYVEQPRSYIATTNKVKPKIGIINIFASILVIAAFFIPWMDMTQFKEAGELEIVTGMDMYMVFNLFNLESFTDISNYTIYLIPLGAIIALIGELLRNWAIRSMGQILTICFGSYWVYKIYHLFSHTEIHAEELVLMDYLQYGFFIMVLGVVFYFVDIMRTTFGNR
ncbi:MAG: hypothetical protein ACI94Y_004315 [Maribacter sp.]|jgi:hypothetical protein